MEIPDNDLSWQELDEYVKTQLRFSSLLWKIQSEPIDTKKIESLCLDGWRICFEESNLVLFFEGLCNSENKRIKVSPRIHPYKRDKIICHELVHAYYGKEASDRFKTTETDAYEKRLIVNWAARQIRGNPTLLTEIWKTFNIPPRIYDRASLLATQELERPQLLFPSFEKDYNFTLMD